MRIGAGIMGLYPANGGVSAGKKSRFPDGKNLSQGADTWAMSESRLRGMGEPEKEGEEGEAVPFVRSEAERIYDAAVSGKRNPIENVRQAPKVPYGHLAKDGEIVYNGVIFVCDEETNSICLGDMSDKKNVLNIPLSGGGHLKVNRNSIGQLSRAAGMFTPEDLNLIMRAVAQDTKIQETLEEIEDEAAGVGNRIAKGQEAEQEAGEQEAD